MLPSLFYLKKFLSPAFVFISAFCFSQTDTIIVHIMHGSRPVKHTQGYHDPGGYLGGHAVVQVDSFVYGFNYTGRRIHPFPFRRHRNGLYQKESISNWKKRTADDEVSIFHIPVSHQTHELLKNTYENYFTECPHDYAFLGMRCAASAYWMLGKAGIFRLSSRRRSIIHSFHPKMLRKKLVRLAARNHWKTEEQKGSALRKWEGV